MLLKVDNELRAFLGIKKDRRKTCLASCTALISRLQRDCGVEPPYTKNASTKAIGGERRRKWAFFENELSLSTLCAVVGREKMS